jgi:hypothetical protein
MCVTVELQNRVSTLESKVAVLFLKAKSFKLLKNLIHKKFNNFPLSVLYFQFGIFFIGFFKGKSRLELMMTIIIIIIIIIMTTTIITSMMMLIKYCLLIVLIVVFHIIRFCFLNSTYSLYTSRDLYAILNCWPCDSL